jgi:anthranilate synthase/aminodeoxychorismate synthase-like glutamine amidotransferase
MKKVLLLDNYDSFTYNLFQYLSELGVQCNVYKNDEVTIDQIKEAEYSHIVISPGPGSPHNSSDVGICSDVISELHESIPILGVCLGCQLVAVKFGGEVVKSDEIMHGMRSDISVNLTLQNNKLFEGLGGSFEAMRYHSLIIDEETLPDCLEVTARSKSGLVMATQHKHAPLYGVQFHPESIGTDTGHEILANFLS